MIWKVSDSSTKIGGVDFIRADSLDEAREIYCGRHHYNYPDIFQPCEDNEKIFAVYLSDSPGSPAFFKGTKAEVKRSANLYIRQWQLDAVVDKIVEV